MYFVGVCGIVLSDAGTWRLRGGAVFTSSIDGVSVCGQLAGADRDLAGDRDGRRLASAAGHLTLTLATGDPSVAGMYQCHVTGALGTAQVRVGGQYQCHVTHVLGTAQVRVGGQYQCHVTDRSAPHRSTSSTSH